MWQGAAFEIFIAYHSLTVHPSAIEGARLSPSWKCGILLSVVARNVLNTIRWMDAIRLIKLLRQFIYLMQLRLFLPQPASQSKHLMDWSIFSESLIYNPGDIPLAQQPCFASLAAAFVFLRATIFAILFVCSNCCFYWTINAAHVPILMMIQCIT